MLNIKKQFHEVVVATMVNHLEKSGVGEFRIETAGDTTVISKKDSSHYLRIVSQENEFEPALVVSLMNDADCTIDKLYTINSSYAFILDAIVQEGQQEVEYATA